jgi:hypothetical protein
MEGRTKEWKERRMYERKEGTKGRQKGDGREMKEGREM